MSTVTIVVSPRERFSFSEASLESIYANTDSPFDLVYVDGGSPRRVRDYLRRAAAEKGFVLIRREHYLSPNQARNLGAAQVGTDYVVFIDNDVIVERGWLQALVACADETGAWVVGSVYCIGDPAKKVIHMAGGDARIVEEPGGRVFREQHLHAGKRLADLTLTRTETELAEFHCMLVRRSALQQLGPLDEGLLCSREHIDLCLQVREAGGTVYIEPAAVITYVPGPPFTWSDGLFYLLRWSDRWGFATVRHFHQKWRLNNPDHELIERWIRRHRRELFGPLRKAVVRLVGYRIGGRLSNLGVAVAEACGTALAMRHAPPAN